MSARLVACVTAFAALALPGPALALDVTPPDSSAQPPAYANSTTITIPYTAADDAGGSGIAHVDLYAKAPGDLFYSDVASVTPDVTAFSYAATAGDGDYSFYTVAVDNAGNTELPPLAGDDGSTLLDTTLPDSAAGPATAAPDGTITVPYTASDSGSGIGSVELWAEPPGASAYTLAATNTDPASTSFTYTGGGPGDYSFYTVAVDKAGNREAAPSAADTTVTIAAPQPAPAPAPPPPTTTTPAPTTTTTTVVQLPAPPPATAAPSTVAAPSLPLVAALTLPPKQTLRSVLKHGLLMKLFAYRPVKLQVALVLPHAAAKRVGLARRPTVAQRLVTASDPKIYTVKLVLERAARVKLRRQRRITLTLRSTLRSSSGSSTSSTPIPLR